MKLCLPLMLVVLAMGFGCATNQPPPAFEPVPGPSNIDPALGSLATETGRQVYAAKEKPKKQKPAKKKPKPTPENPAPIVSPDTSLPGTVMTYNEPGRFVVLNFPIGRMPAIGDRMFVYRNGLKVGEVKIAGPRRDDNIVADLVAGEAQPKDQVRDK